MPATYTLTCTPEYAASIIRQTVEDGSITGELIDRYDRQAGEYRCIVLVFEKHYYRVGQRLTLTVTIDNLSGTTRIHTVGGGGGEGLFGFDWGAAESFETSVLRALEDVMQK